MIPALWAPERNPGSKLKWGLQSVRFFAALFFLLSCDLILSSCHKSPQSVYQKPVAQVNDVTLSVDEFGKRLGAQLKIYDAIMVKDPATLFRVKDSIIKDFIIAELINIWASQNNISVSKEELDSEVSKIRAGYPNDVAFREALAREGSSFETWQRKLLNTLVQRKLFKFLEKSLPDPTPDEIKAYYDSHKEAFQTREAVKVQQIVVKKRSHAQYLLNLVKKGGDWADLAKRYSIAPEAQSKGITDWIEKGSLNVFDKAFALPVGQLSNVIKSPYGFHIFKVIEKQKSGSIPFDQVKVRIRETLLAAKEQSAFSQWIEGQARAAKIMQDDKLINAITVETVGKRP